MTLAAGTHLGPYKILSLIGVGGMGEVYKGHDTRLDRIVAIKVLPPHLAERADLLERFEREAKAVAALKHPNIVELYDIGHENGIHFLVFEYLDGETVAARVEKGPIPLDQALKIAIEISDALDKAHRAGFTHRDIKTGNLMITKSCAKLLDFGLAKLKTPETAPPTRLSELPTKAALTAEGTLLGTMQYMAPEQLEGMRPMHGQISLRLERYFTRWSPGGRRSKEIARRV